MFTFLSKRLVLFQLEVILIEVILKKWPEFYKDLLPTHRKHYKTAVRLVLHELSTNDLKYQKVLGSLEEYDAEIEKIIEQLIKMSPDIDEQEKEKIVAAIRQNREYDIEKIIEQLIKMSPDMDEQEKEKIVAAIRQNIETLLIQKLQQNLWSPITKICHDMAEKKPTPDPYTC